VPVASKQLPRRSSRGDTGKKIVFFVTEHGASSLTLVNEKEST
jgi:hypothetical protein